MPDVPEIRYAKSGDVHIAYQVVGDGEVDLVHSPGIWSNLEIMWEWPEWSRYLHRLAAFSRLILFDMRGVGLSDRGADPPTLERQVDDIGAVMNAAQSPTAVIFGGARASAMTMLFAASFPERTQALVLYAPFAKTLRSADWPFGRTEREQELFYDRFTREMGTAKNLDLQGPSHDARLKRWWGRFERLGASPGAWREMAEILGQLDIRHVLPNIRVPTLVIQRTGDLIVDIGQGREIAKRIPQATFVELRGDDHIPFLGDADTIVDEIEEFLTGVRPVPERDRVLATVLFTDIVGSTEHAVALGDHAWRALLDDHDQLVRDRINRFRGRCVKTTGDGVLATFDGPGRAIRCAQAIRDDVHSIGIAIRAGLHSGEVELRGDDVGGIAVHIGARVAAIAHPGQVLVSSTVKDLVAGSGLSFSEAGDHTLKGVPDTWRLFAVED
ncbi:MAG: adenylate/guanylate cyclase domain-containing protein [Acidimicrobiales bacterium]